MVSVKTATRTRQTRKTPVPSVRRWLDDCADACWVLRYINRGAYLRQTPDREWRLCEAHEATQFASQTVAEDALVDVQHWACRSGERGAKTLRLALSGGVVLVEMWAVAYQRESR